MLSYHLVGFGFAGPWRSIPIPFVAAVVLGPDSSEMISSIEGISPTDAVGRLHISNDALFHLVLPWYMTARARPVPRPGSWRAEAMRVEWTG